jgi:hypothetical protein
MPKTKVVKPIASGTKDYSLKLNYNVDTSIKPKKISEKEIFEMMGGKKSTKKKKV